MKSLSIRLAVIISSIILLLVVMMTLWVDRVLTQAIEEQGIEQADVHAQTLLGSLKTLMLNGNGTLAREWIDRLHGVAGIEDLEVIRRDGKPAFTDLETVTAVNEYLGQPRFQRKTYDIHKGFNPIPPQIFDRVLNGEVSYDLSQQGITTVLMPIQADIECLACHGYDSTLLRGVLKLSISSKHTDDRITDMKALLWFWAVFLVTVLAVAVWLSLRVSVIKPVNELRAAIMSAGEGDRSAHITVANDDEVGELAIVFNQMQKDLAAYEARIRAVMDNVVDGIITINEEGIIDAVNPAVEHIFIYKTEELVGQHVDILIPDSMREQNESFLLEDLDTERKNVLVGVAREISGKKKNNSIFPMDIAVSDMHLNGKRYFIAIVRDITSRKARIAALHYQAMHDALTDLPNRTLLLDRLQQAIRAAERDGNELALILIDLDRFKEVNDTLGHLVGDKLLQQISQRLRESLRESDTVARLGGDEFCLLLPTADEEQAVIISQKVIAAIGEKIYIEGHSLYIGASLGIATFPKHGNSPLVLLQRADVAMYVAKRGKRGYSVYDSLSDQHSLKQLAISTELKEAIKHNELVLYFQPKMDLKTNTLSGVEALVRWDHPKHGLLLPDEFVPLAEQTGLIRPLTVWVLQQALEECQYYVALGYDLQVSVNLSMVNLSDPHFADEIVSVLKRYSVDPARLKLEITETCLMDEPDNVITALNRLHDMGFHISIDDFGIGYSSLTYLQKLPVSELKIDKSFGLSLVGDTNSVVIVRSTIDLAHKLGLEVVAEGIESKEALAMLGEFGCDSGQGFFLGRPMPMSEMLKWIAVSQEWETESPSIEMA